MHGVEQHGGVLDRLGESIASGARPAGTVLTLAGLEQEFGVSRTLVREVVRVLESMGMVTSRRRVGVTVRPREEWNPFDPRLIRWRLAGPGRDAQLLDLTELRAAIEPVAARLAATRAGEPDRRELVVLAARLRELGEAGRGTDPEYLETDVSYHALLLAASGNPMLSALGGVVAEVLSGRTALGLMPRWPDLGALEDHEATAAAVSRGDAVTAEQRARSVVAEVLEEVVEGRDRAGGRVAARSPMSQDGNVPPAGSARRDRSTKGTTMVDIGGFADKAKDLAAQHPDRVEQGIERGGDAVDQRTGDKYRDQVDQAQERAGDFLGTGEADRQQG